MNLPGIRRVQVGRAAEEQQAVYRPGAELFFIMLLLAIMVFTGLTYFLYHRDWDGRTSGPDMSGQTGSLSAAAALEIVGRGSETAGLKRTAASWPERLADGRASLADYLMRLFVSPDYLSRQRDDTAFIGDLQLVLAGQALDQAGLASESAILETAGSRLIYLNDRLNRLGYAGDLPLADGFTRLRTLTVADDRPAAGSDIVGALPIASQARLTGEKASFRLYVDGRIRQELAVDHENPSLEQTYVLEWDTSYETAGEHHLAMLVQTGDGRGAWIDLASYRVPEIQPLTIGQVLQSGTAGAATPDAEPAAAWYRLPAMADGRVLLNILLADTGLQVQLFDRYSRLLAETACPAGQPAALRYRPADGQAGIPAGAADEPAYFVRIRPAGEAASRQAAHFILVPALAAAVPADEDPVEPALIRAVLERSGDRILVQDDDGKSRWQDASGYSVIDPTARLSVLGLSFSNGNRALFYPAFDPAIDQYGLVVDAAADRLALAVQAMEGSAAAVEITSGTEQGSGRTLSDGEAVPLEPAANNLTVTVTGFDGSRKSYQIAILRPPDAQGFHLVLGQFPAAYQSPLWLLHVHHPAWQFEADRTGQDWQAFLDAQDAADMNLADADSSPAAWIEPGSPVYDGDSWKAAARPVIAHFADPRNFLDDTGIFQFEQLTFSEQAQTREGLDSILAGSFMEPQLNGIDYAGLIMAAGQEAGISPYYLAAKIIQEMGRQGQSPLAFGQLPGYEGLYNFYNIGATPDPGVENGAQINGARFALYGRDAGQGEITAEESAWLLPWNTPERAIKGGARWIAERYVRIGQDTLYAQKFDLIAADGLYIHQYAQNIQMAWAEGRRVRQAYAGLGLLDLPFVFKIPVFDAMPAEAAGLP